MYIIIYIYLLYNSLKILTLLQGAPAVIRNIGLIRRLYSRYSSLSSDRQFRLIHVDRLCIDFNIAQLTPITHVYPEGYLDPLRLIRFREFCLILVTIAYVLWPTGYVNNFL